MLPHFLIYKPNDIKTSILLRGQKNMAAQEVRKKPPLKLKYNTKLQQIQLILEKQPEDWDR